MARRSAQIGAAKGQREEKRQPSGIWPMLGTEPGTVDSLRRGPVSEGTETINPMV